MDAYFINKDYFYIILGYDFEKRHWFNEFINSAACMHYNSWDKIKCNGVFLHKCITQIAFIQN